MKAIVVLASRIAPAFYVLGAHFAVGAAHPGVVVAWGGNDPGPTNVPPGLVNVVGIAGGISHSLALRGDGTVVGWGGGGYGQANVPLGLTNVIAIAAGWEHSLTLKSDGTVLAWGNSNYGQTNVPGSLTNATAIAGNWGYSLALRRDKTVAAWGYYYDNAGGWLPMIPPSGLSNVVGIAAGNNHALAVKADGTVVAWGANFNGQTNVPPSLSNVVAVSASSHSLALRADGTVVAWPNFISLPDGLSNVVAIAAGGSQDLALRADGSVVAWGYQTSVPEGLSNVVAIGAGVYHSLAITLVPAILSKPPAAISLRPADATNLVVNVWSGTPLGCQWFRDGFPIPGATWTNLVIDNFDLSKAGAYSFLVTNQYASATAVCVLRLSNSPVVLVDGVDVGGGGVSRVDSAQITMASSFGADADIYYTSDGGAPDFTALQYLGPFILTNSATIRAIAYSPAYTDWAEAAPINVQISPTYLLSASTPGGGSISASPAPYGAGNRYVSNTVVTLTATPASGWSFVRWTGDSHDTTNVTTVLMDQPRTIQAVFGTSLNLFTNGNGHVLVEPPTPPYAFGSTVRLTALPATGSYFFGWAGAASGFSNPLQVAVINAAGITALFGTLRSNQVSLTVLPRGDGSVDVSPAKNVYTNGEAVILTAIPATNNVFSGWGGGASGSLNPLALTLSSSALITADFVPGTPTNPPTVTQPPLSRTLSPGSTTVLAFQAEGDGPFSYQWRFNGSPLGGATSPVLVLNHITAPQAGLYDVVVTGTGGTTTSAAASVAVFGLELASGQAGSMPLLTLDAAPGTRYHLEFSGDLSRTNWGLLVPVTMQNSTFYYVDQPVSSQPKRFYRAVPR